jgi:hypothetical protein
MAARHGPLHTCSSGLTPSSTKVAEGACCRSAAAAARTVTEVAARLLACCCRGDLASSGARARGRRHMLAKGRQSGPTRSTGAKAVAM